MEYINGLLKTGQPFEFRIAVSCEITLVLQHRAQGPPCLFSRSWSLCPVFCFTLKNHAFWSFCVFLLLSAYDFLLSELNSCGQSFLCDSLLALAT